MSFTLLYFLEIEIFKYRINIKNTTYSSFNKKNINFYFRIKNIDRLE